MVLIPVESVRTRPSPAAAPCELCAEPLPPHHRHLLDVTARTLCCACQACALLFDRPDGRYRSVPDRRRRLPAGVLDEATWARLRIPVRMAFLYYDTAADGPVAFYPSPAGAVGAELAPDMEALLVDRTGAELPGQPGGACYRESGGEHFLVPIDDCYALVGLVRTHWQGFTGGERLWQRVAEFFADLRAHATGPLN